MPIRADDVAWAERILRREMLRRLLCAACAAAVGALTNLLNVGR